MSTERADPRYRDVATWPTETAVAAMLEGQLAAVAAVQSQVGAVAAAAEAAADRLSAGGGRLCYAGAGTSGRIALQDGVELWPTYSWPMARLVFLMAGGVAAVTASVEGAEDDADAARAAVAAAAIGPADVLIGVAASGTTPYAIAAVEAARSAGALTIAIANNPAAPLLTAATHAILADTGSEIVAGSTRMKAGTAQKAALNCLSTAIMLRLGLVHHGLMVNMRASNAKLVARAARMVRDLAGVDAARADAAVALAHGDVRIATLIAHGLAPEAANELLAAHAGSLDRALSTLSCQAKDA